VPNHIDACERASTSPEDAPGHTPDDAAGAVRRAPGNVLAAVSSTWAAVQARPVIVRPLRAVVVFAVGVLAITLALQLPWYPNRIDHYVLTAALSAVAIGFGRRLPLALLLGMAVAVGWPGWSFEVSEVRLIPLGIAGFLAASGGLRLVIALPVAAAGAVSAMIPSWVWAAPTVSRVAAGLAVENLSIRALAFCIVLAAVMLGRASFAQARDAAELRRRNVELERLRESDRERIANEERTAIAREIHDVVAHHISAMVIRAQGAARMVDSRPEELRTTVEWIAASGQEALTAMRNVVRVLRGTEQGGTTQAPLELGHALHEVIDRVRGAGLHVVDDVEVPPGLTAIEEFAVLRVCQEALTNVLIHSDAEHVHVALTVLAGDLVLYVEDDGAPVSTTSTQLSASGPDSGTAPHTEGGTRTSPASRTTRRAGTLGSGGTGIRGMQERAEAVGGTLVAGPGQRGWRVELLVPLRPGDHGTATATATPTPTPLDEQDTTA
jgi:signal transduction histidine kinase